MPFAAEDFACSASVAATPAYSLISLIGAVSIIAAVVSLLAAFAASGLSPLPPAARRAITVVAPTAFWIACTLLEEGSTFFSLDLRRHWWPDEPDAAAVVIYAAFGFGFALANFRLRGRMARTNAVVFTFAYGVFIAHEIDLGPTGLYPIVGCLAAWLFIVIAGVPAAIMAMMRCRRDLRQRRRLSRAGLCAVCGYDLRATPDRCPECGTPRPSAADPLPV